MAFSDVLLAFDESIRASDTFVNSTIDNRTQGSCPSFSLEKPSLMRYSWGRRPVAEGLLSQDPTGTLILSGHLAQLTSFSPVFNFSCSVKIEV